MVQEWKTRVICFMAVSLMLIPGLWAQTVPTVEISDPVTLEETLFTKAAGIAVNTHEPEILITTVDTENFFQFPDPISGEIGTEAVIGFYVNPMTLEVLGDPFIILGNNAEIETHDVKYNPVTNQYVVVASAHNRATNGTNQVPLLALVNPRSVAGTGNPVAKAWVNHPDSDQDYDDVAVAVSTKNGSFMVAAEKNFTGESEGVVGVLYDKDGNSLTPSFTKLDQLEPARDEDDPDIFYLEENDVYLFITNIDPSTSPNRITATIIQSTPDSSGLLQQGTQQIVSELRKNLNAGHAAAIENPFTKEFIGGFDYNNSPDGGDLFYFNIGPAPNYTFTESRTQVAYVEATGSNPFAHRHPQFAVDQNSGVIIVSYNYHGGPAGINGMACSLLGPDGGFLPGPAVGAELYPDLPEGHPPVYIVAETTSAISDSANYHNVKYDPFSDSFIVVYATGNNITQAARLKVLSDHRPADVSAYMIY